MYEDYQGSTDEELIDRLRQGEKQITDYIIDKYKNLVRRKAKSMYILGADRDDLIQEGMIGLYNAIGHYDESKASSFMTYAAICINNKLISAVSADARKKNAPLNGYVSIYSMITDETGEEASLSDVLPDTENINPESIILNEEQENLTVNHMLGKLSKHENEILS